MSTEYATKGQGTAVHIARVDSSSDLVTLCDANGSAGGNMFSGVRKGKVRPAKADAATCKSCLRAAAKAVSA
jgi:hypothetical protein